MNIKSLGLTELSQAEQKKVSGGFKFVFFGLIIYDTEEGWFPQFN